MMYLEGLSALSDTAHASLLNKLREVSNAVSNVAAQFVYFVSVDGTLRDEQCRVLVSLLRSGFGDVVKPDTRQGRSCVVAPHFSRETQWSRDVTRLAQDCGLQQVKRIEQATVYWLVTDAALDDSTNQRLNDVLCDPETQTIFPDVEFAKVMFTESETAQVKQATTVEPAVTSNLWQAEWIINGEHQRETLEQILDRYHEMHHYDLLWQQANWSIVAGIEAPYWFVNQDKVYQQRQVDVHHSLHVSQFNWQSTYQAFDAFCVARGHRLHSVISGYVTPDLLVPNFIQPWEHRAAAQASEALVHLVSTIERRSDYWFQLGMPLLGGFLRTLPVAEQYAASVYGGFVQPESMPVAVTEQVTHLFRVDTTSPRLVARLFSSCVDLGEGNPITASFTRRGVVYCQVADTLKNRFETLARRAGCHVSLMENHVTVPAADESQTLQLRVSELAEPVMTELALSEINVPKVAEQVLALPAVAAKYFIINHTDQTSGGLVVQGALVGPWQVPVSDVAIMANAFAGYSGVAKSCGERATLADLNAMAMARMAIGEAVTNMLAARLTPDSVISIALSWYLHGKPVDAALYEVMQYLTRVFMPGLGLQIVANDIDQDKQPPDTASRSPELTVFAHTNLRDVRHYTTPRLKRHDGETALILIDLGGGLNRMGGSALTQVTELPEAETPDIGVETLLHFREVMDALHEQDWIIAYHDRSDGGLFVTLCEMAFASRLGLQVYLDDLGDNPVTSLFTEELGAVLQVRSEDVDDILSLVESAELTCAVIGEPVTGDMLEISFEDDVIFSAEREALLQQWCNFSKHIDIYAGHAELVATAYQTLADPHYLGLTSRLTFDLSANVPADLEAVEKPMVAILRHPDSQDTRAMAAAFAAAGFTACDVSMHDLATGALQLADYRGMAICGGVSYNDVLAAGKGWAQTILLQPQLHEQFAGFFADTSKFVLGIGNGAQLLSYLRDIIPGTSLWPTLTTNRSQRLESRTCLVKVAASKSIFFHNMTDSHFPVVLSCKHGRAVFPLESTQAQLQQQQECVLQYVDGYSKVAEHYPQNPTGSDAAVAGFCNEDGRITALMVHPERCFRSIQLSWHPGEWGAHTPWLRLFQNARLWLANV